VQARLVLKDGASIDGQECLEVGLINLLIRIIVEGALGHVLASKVEIGVVDIVLYLSLSVAELLSWEEATNVVHNVAAEASLQFLASEQIQLFYIAFPSVEKEVFLLVVLAHGRVVEFWDAKKKSLLVQRLKGVRGHLAAEGCLFDTVDAQVF